MRRLGWLLVLTAMTVSACAGGETGETSERADAIITDVTLTLLESYPVQVRVAVTGALPTPCHRLHFDVDRTEPSRPTVDVHGLAPQDAACLQVLEPFQVTIDLGSFESGEYTVVVNGMERDFGI